MSQTKDLRELLERLRPECKAIAPKVALALVRHAKALHRLYEHRCNRTLTLTEQSEEIRRERAVKRLCDTMRIKFFFNHDPRGFPVKLHFGGQHQPHNTWGGEPDGWGIG